MTPAEPAAIADLCRERGWRPGTRLIGTDHYGSATIMITAVGEELILARQVELDGKPFSGFESGWSLLIRDWREVTDDART